MALSVIVDLKYNTDAKCMQIGRGCVANEAARASP